MRDAFAVIPDEEDSTPTAVFCELEAAISWGLERYGSDAFRIRGVQMTPVESDLRLVVPAA
jgi:hypothetical protein